MTLGSYCPLNKTLDPPGYVVEVDVTDPNVVPKVAEVHLRPGVALNATLRVKNIKLPVDLMFVEDLSNSMDGDLNFLKDNANSLFTSVSTLLHNESMMGFSSFLEKPNSPSGFSDGCTTTGDVFVGHNCYTWPFRLHQVLSSDFAEFQATLNTLASASYTHGNRDTEEDVPDGLVNTVVCDQVGWRNSSRKFVLISSDRAPHFSPEHHIMGLHTPASLVCGELYGNFLASDRPSKNAQAFPTVGQWREVLRERSVTPLFAARVDNGVGVHDNLKVYKALTNQLGMGGVGELLSSSSNLFDIIYESYVNSSRVVQLFVESWNIHNFAIIPQRTFTEVDFDEVVEFTITFYWEKNPDLYAALEAAGGGNISDWSDSLTFSVFGLGKSTWKVYPELFCNCSGVQCPNDCHGNGTCDCGRCNCEPPEAFDTTISPSCGCPTAACPYNCVHGSCVCGQCECISPYSQDPATGVCNCTTTCRDSLSNTIDCGANDSPPRGECVCGVCSCNSPFYSNSSENCECRSDIDCTGLCGEHGDCICGSCVCTIPALWGGEFCNCSKVACEQTCTEPYGRCDCGTCICNAGYELGPLNDCNCLYPSICPSNCTVNGTEHGICQCGFCDCDTNWGWPQPRVSGTVTYLTYEEYMSTYPFLVTDHGWNATEPEEDCSCYHNLVADDCSHFGDPVDPMKGGVYFCDKCYCAPDYFGEKCSCNNVTDTCDAFGGCNHGECKIEACENALADCVVGECWVRCICDNGWTKSPGSKSCDSEISPFRDQCVLTLENCEVCTGRAGCGFCESNGTVFSNVTYSGDPAIFFSNVTHLCYNESSPSTNLCPWALVQTCPSFITTSDAPFEEAKNYLILSGISILFVLLMVALGLLGCLLCTLFICSKLGGALGREQKEYEKELVDSLNPLYEEKNETHFNPLFTGLTTAEGEMVELTGGEDEDVFDDINGNESYISGSD